MFQKVTRKQNRLRLALDGPSGAGKTYTALRFAFAIVERWGGRVGVIDTEHNSASLYAGEAPDGIPWDWEGVNLEHFAPSTYTQAVGEAARRGYEVLVIDSLSHAWTGTGGALDQVDRASAQAGGKFTAWREVTPQHTQMIDALLRYPGHLIVTMRTKMEYLLEEDEKGRTRVRKIGLKPVQREGVEYEFTIVADMDEEHRLKVSKTRCRLIDGKIVAQPGPAFLAPVLDWLGEAPGEEVAPAALVVEEPPPPPTNGVRLQAPDGVFAGEVLGGEIVRLWRDLGRPADDLRAFLEGKGVARVAELPRATAEELETRLRHLDLERQAKEAF